MSHVVTAQTPLTSATDWDSFLLPFSSRVLKEQVNVSSHVPGCGTNNVTCQEEAVFRPIQSQGWLWIVLPISVYLVDYTFRLVRRNVSGAYVVGVEQVQDGMVLTISSPYQGFVTRPGQFVLLQCPVISRLEWHPFTVTKVSWQDSKALVWVCFCLTPFHDFSSSFTESYF